MDESANRIMSVTPTLKGRFVTLRPVNEADAEYILSIRTDSERSYFLKPVENNVEKQRAWITEHNRRADGHYFVIINSQQQPCGLIRIHDITKKQYTIGSWLVGPECGGFAAIESLMLILSYGIEVLDCERSIGMIREDNTRLITIYESLGGRCSGRQENFLEYEMTKESLQKAKKKYQRFNYSGLV